MATEDDALADLDTGDVILFDRRCGRMSAFGALVCVSAKLTTQSQWDHIGVILKHSDGSLHVCEANLSGVKIRPLLERIARSDSHEIAVRRVLVARTPETRAQIESFVHSIADRPYETNVLVLLNAAVENRAKAQGETLSRDLENLLRDRDALEAELHGASNVVSELQRAALLRELRRIDDERVPALQRALAEQRSLFENPHDLSKLFCSELVAASFQAAGWLPALPAAANYTPKSFSTSSRLPLLGHVALGPLQYVRRHRSSAAALPFSGAGNGKVRGAVDVADNHRSPPAFLEHTLRASLLAHVACGANASRILASADDRARLLSVLEPVAYRPGDVVCEAGSADADASVYFIENGECDVVATADGGDVCLGVLGAGNSFGAQSMLFGRTAPVTIRAATHGGGDKSGAILDGGMAADGTVRMWRLRRSQWEAFVGENLGAMRFHLAADAQLDAASKELLNEVLNTHSLFKRYRLRAQQRGDAEFRDAALASFYQLRFAAGETIISQGDRGDLFYVVANGQCRVEQKEMDGAVPAATTVAATATPISIYHAGQSFGEASLLYDSPRGASVRALTDTTLLVVDRATFQRLSGAGSKFLQRVFAAHASARVGNEKRMTKADFLRAMRATTASTSTSSASESSVDRLMLQLVKRGTSGDTISFSEFVHFDILLSSRDCEVKILFHLLDRRRCGVVTRDDFCTLVTLAAAADGGSAPPDRAAVEQHPLVRLLFGERGERALTEFEFCDAVHAGGSDGRGDKLRHLHTLFPLIFADLGVIRATPTQASFGGADAGDTTIASASTTAAAGAATASTPFFTGLYLLSSGVAGAVARTAVAPLERVRLLMQTQSLLAGGGSTPIRNVLHGLRDSVRQDGWRAALFRGNGLNVARIVPCLALEYGVFEALKAQWLRYAHISSSFPRRAADADRLSLLELAALGGGAAVASNLLLYPLDLLRAAVTVQRGPLGVRARDVVRDVFQRHGWRALYRGGATTSFYIAPYGGISLAASESLRPLLRDGEAGASSNTLWLVAGTALAAVCAQFAVYPLDTLRRLQQVSIVSTPSTSDSWSVRSLCAHVWRTRGVRGFYAGFSATLVKALPSAAVSALAIEHMSCAIRAAEK